MRITFRKESKIWMVFFITILCSAYIHEIGHCIPAWINGFEAVPTPAKEYILDEIPSDLQEYVSLGGIIGSVLAAFIGILLFMKKQDKYNSALLAGVISIPGIYGLRFILAGRGHDGTEFQEAQSAIGLHYSGHSLDWLFLFIFFQV